MGYGGIRITTHSHHHSTFTTNRHRHTAMRAAPARRHHYGGAHHIYHSTAYYGGDKTEPEQPVPVLPQFTVLYQVTSPFQTIKIVEFNDQFIENGPNAANTNITNPNQISNDTTLANNTDEIAPPSYNSLQPLANDANNNNTITVATSNPTTAASAVDAAPPESSTNIQIEGKPDDSNAVAAIKNDEIALTTDTSIAGSNIIAVATDNDDDNIKNTVEIKSMDDEKTKEPKRQRHKGLVLDNEIQFSTLDEADYHNVLVHSAMNALFINDESEENKLRVLIIGGGDCCCVRELVKYDASIVSEIVMIEIDEMVVNTCKQWFPEMTNGINDARVNIIYQDANVWVKQQIENMKVSNINEVTAAPAMMNTNDSNINNVNSENNAVISDDTKVEINVIAAEEEKRREREEIVKKSNLSKFDLIICDLTEDGSLSLPLVDASFWQNLTQLLKCDAFGSINGIIMRNGYHKPSIKLNESYVMNYHYFLSTNLPTFGGSYVFSLMSNKGIYHSLNQFQKVNSKMSKFNIDWKEINTKVNIATAQDLEHAYNYYYYNPKSDHYSGGIDSSGTGTVSSSDSDPWYGKYPIIPCICLIAIIIIIVVVT